MNTCVTCDDVKMTRQRYREKATDELPEWIMFPENPLQILLAVAVLAERYVPNLHDECQDGFHVGYGDTSNLVLDFVDRWRIWILERRPWMDTVWSASMEWDSGPRSAFMDDY